MPRAAFKTVYEEFDWNVSRIITAAEVFLGIEALRDSATGRTRDGLHVRFDFAAPEPRCGAGCPLASLPKGNVPQGKIIAYEAGGLDLVGTGMRLWLHVVNDDDPVFRVFATFLVFDGRDWALRFRDARLGDDAFHLGRPTLIAP
jgi:hypothetical protein